MIVMSIRVWVGLCDLAQASIVDGMYQGLPAFRCGGWHCGGCVAGCVPVVCVPSEAQQASGAEACGGQEGEATEAEEAAFWVHAGFPAPQEEE